MSDASFHPSSLPLQETWHMSQQHYYEYKQEQTRKHERRQSEKENQEQAKRIKQEPSSPCVTPRASAVKTKILIGRQYQDALNSQMGDNTCIEKWINERASTSSATSPSPAFDDMDMDLLHICCIEAETQRDDVLEELHQMHVELRQIEAERDQALAKCDEWEVAAMSASGLVRMASALL
ncbi:hypothetical protein C8R44DRAFT_892580 [Mycena epipterygia]|nr:hypothetical protein C8R44DRAFT_892580 [Mycena epipterygia]